MLVTILHNCQMFDEIYKRNNTFYIFFVLSMKIIFDKIFLSEIFVASTSHIQQIAQQPSQQKILENHCVRILKVHIYI